MQNDDIKSLCKQGGKLALYLSQTRGIQIGGAAEKQIPCPNSAAHAHGDKNPSARYYASPDEHIHCHGCGGHWDIFDLVCLDNGWNAETDFPAALKFCAERFGLDYSPTESPISKYVKDCAAHYPETDYLVKRGISLETAARFRVGFDPAEKRVVFPQGAGYVARSIETTIPEGTLRYKYPKGVAVAPFNLRALWNPEKTPVFIVEGQIDALSILEVGGQAVGLGGMTHQKPLLDAIKERPISVPVCVSFDNDGSEKTNAQARQLVEELEKLGVHIFPAYIYPDGCKDANDALLKDRDAFKGAILGAYEDLRIEQMLQAKKTFSLWEVPEPIPEEKNPRALIKNGYFRKGHGMIIVSTSGAGKSVMSIQFALHLALGRDFFNISPVRPLKVGIVQAEDDIEELGFFKTNMANGLKEEYGWTDEEVERACKSITFETILGKSGDRFVEELRGIQKRAKYDIVFVNPLFSYFGGNLSDSRDDTHFFREMIDPLIKNPVYGFGLIFIHHANKPPKGQDRKGWGTDAFAQYIGAGGTDVAGWARAQLVLTPIDGEYGWFRLIAAKRAGQLGWKDADGNRTQERIISYGKRRVLWCDPRPEEIPESVRKSVKGASNQCTEEFAIEKMVAHLQAVPSKTTDFFNWCCELFTGMKSKIETPPKLAYLKIIGRPQEYGLEAVKGKHGATILQAKTKPNKGDELPIEAIPELDDANEPDDEDEPLPY